MSLKDDFLEALRSVKRDFFRESDGTDRESQQFRENDRPESGDASVRPQHNVAQQDDRDLPRGSVEDPAYRAFVPEADLPADQTDEEVFSAFEQAASISDQDEDGFEDLTGDNYGEEDDLPGDTTPYRSYDAAGMIDRMEEAYDSALGEDGGSGRSIMDFEPTGMLGDDKTIISRNTVIRGALQTDDSVRLLGQIHGDIDCRSNIVVAGKVRGNTSAANAYIFDAQVDGDVRCDDIINISNDAWVLGNIRAQQAEIDGKIKGNIEIRHMVSIGSSSSVLGDISADELEIKRGAFVNGQIMMYSPSRDVLDRFDQFDK